MAHAGAARAATCRSAEREHGLNAGAQQAPRAQRAGLPGDDGSAGQGARPAGHVAALFLRRTPGAPPEAVTQVCAIAGLGLDGDVHSDRLSPRQLLVAGTPAYQRLLLPQNALRENLLLDFDSATLASSQLLAVGAAVFHLTFACEPCGRLNLRQDRLSRSIGAQRGMLARVLHGGVVTVGDPVRLLASTLPSWPDDWRARVEAVLMQVPAGCVVEYRQLALLAGVALTYCRVFPRVARALGLAHKAVALRSDCPLPRWDGAGLFDSPGAGAPGRPGDPARTGPRSDPAPD